MVQSKYSHAKWEELKHYKEKLARSKTRMTWDVRPSVGCEYMLLQDK